MNPYESPKTPSQPENSPDRRAKNLGPRCPNCGSTDTSVDSVLRAKPSILGVIFFGWFFLLIKGAFAMRTSFCRSCGESNRYKSMGSWIVLSILILFILLVLATILSDPG